MLGFNAVTNRSDDRTSIDTSIGKRYIPGKSVAFGTDLLNMAKSSHYDTKHEAVRKLIHEGLHVKFIPIKDDQFEDIHNIFSDFVKSLDSVTDVELKKRLLEYTYPEYPREENGNLTRKGIEEFVIECLTSKTLANYLNNVKVEEQKETLLNKLINALCEMLGIEVNTNSLYHEALTTIDALTGGLDIVKDNNVESETKKDDNDDIETVDESTNTNIENTQTDREFGDLEFSAISENYTTEMQDIKDKAIADGTFSEINDSYDTYASINAYLNQFSGETYEQVKAMIDSGEIEIKCKLN